MTFLETKGDDRVRGDTEAPSLISGENNVTMDKTTKSGRKAHFSLSARDLAVIYPISFIKKKKKDLELWDPIC